MSRFRLPSGSPTDDQDHLSAPSSGYHMYFPMHNTAATTSADSPPHSGTMTPTRRTAREILIEQLCKPNMAVLDRMYPLLCHQCGMSFIRQVHLTAHMQLHQSQSGLKCPECENFCHDSLSLQDHLEEAHSPERAFKVSYSIAERISYMPPYQMSSITPSCMTPPSEPLPDDFTYQSAFGRPYKRRQDSMPSSPESKSTLSPPRKRNPKMSILETLLLTNSPSPLPHDVDSSDSGSSVT